MTPLALDNWVATALVFGPAVTVIVLEHGRFRGDLGRRRADSTYRWLQAWQLAALVLGIAAAKWIPAATLPGNAWLWVAVGCAVELAGIGLRVWAIRALGEQFTRHLEVGEEHRLVYDGPYRHLRHPSYTGAILMYTGVGIGLGNALSMLAFALLPTVGYVQRIPREEALLRSGLGGAYDDYAQRTRRLVPGVW